MSVLLFSWAVWIVLAVLLHLLLPWCPYLPAVFSDMLTYGKLKDNTRAATNPSSSFYKLYETMNSVPRSYFTHFYLWGTLWNFLLIGSYCFPYKATEEQFEAFLTLTLLFFQTLRRLMECWYITRHSNRKMHIVHYVLGLYFYTAVGPTAMLHSNTHELVTLRSLIQWRHVVAVVLFIWASYHQYHCHRILAGLRSTTTEKSPHDDSGPETQNVGVGIPEGDWFELVSCPHYFAEILIYCSLVLVEWGSHAMLLPCIFVVCVLMLSARQTHSWYCSKFSDYPKSRRRIIPYVF